MLDIRRIQIIMENLDLCMWMMKIEEEDFSNEILFRSKRNGATREILSDPIQPFDASSTRPNSSERWSNSYNNGNRSQHKSDSRHSSDR